VPVRSLLLKLELHCNVSLRGSGEGWATAL
jgi:hypothetical protein